MKTKIQLFFILSVSLALSMLAPFSSLAEEKPDTAEVKIESRLLLNYLCTSDSVILTATLSIRKGDYTLALENAPVVFTITTETGSQPLGKVLTDQEGIAKFKAAVGNFPADKEGLVTYMASFPGTPKYPGADASTSAKPAKVKLFFSIEDSLRILKVTATQKNAKGEEIPIPKETVHIYVPRLFSLLKIGEISLDESGIGTLEFPKEIVGDTLGNLVVIAKIEEHDVFGFAQGQNTINWGVHKQYYKAEVPSRELWTPIAPMWMIITLLIMLAGVWAHYFYAVYELIMIKRLGKNDKKPL